MVCPQLPAHNRFYGDVWGGCIDLLCYLMELLRCKGTACRQWLLPDDPQLQTQTSSTHSNVLLFSLRAPFAPWPPEVLSSLPQNFPFFLWQSGWLISANPPCSFNTCRKRAASGCYGNVVWLTAERWVREMSSRICGQLDMRLQRCMNRVAMFRWLIVHQEAPIKGFYSAQVMFWWYTHALLTFSILGVILIYGHKITWKSSYK